MSADMKAPLPYHKHDHRQCIKTALEQAEAICKEQGARLTPLRRQVLEQVWESHTSLGAYDLLDRLTVITGKRIAPPTVYRALDFLLELGLIHKVNSLNTYIGSISPSQKHQAYLMICKHCHIVLEVNSPSLQKELENSVDGSGFLLESSAVELVGSCPNCLKGAKNA